MANGTQVGSIYYDLDLDDSKFKAGSASAKNEAKTLNDSLNKIDFASVGQKAGSTFSGIADSMQNVITKFALLATGSSVGLGAILSYAGGLQQTSRSYDILIGDTQTANALFAQLVQYANTTPFESAQITKAGQILLGYGIQSKDVYNTIKILGDAAASTGADFQSLALVYGQVNASGHLMGQDALQLINNNIPVTSILAKQLGISIQDVRDKMQAGTISSQMFDDALRKMTEKGGSYFNGAAVQADTFNGRLSTLQDSVKQFGLALVGVKTDPQLGFVIQPGGIFDRISQLIPKIGAELTALTPKFSAGFTWIMDHGKDVLGVLAAILSLFLEFRVLGIISPLIGKFMDGFKEGKTVLAGMQAVVAPLGGSFFLIGAAIAIVVAGLVFLQVKFNIFGKAIQAIKPFLDDVKQGLEFLGAALTGADPTVGAVGEHWVKFTQYLVPIQTISLAVQKAIEQLWYGILAFFSALDGNGRTSKGFVGFMEQAGIYALILYNILKPIAEFVGRTLWQAFQSLWSILVQLWDAFQPLIHVLEIILANKIVQDVLKAIAIAMLALFAGPMIAGFAFLIGALKLLQIVLKFVADHFTIIKDVVLALIAIALWPLTLAIGAIVLIVKEWSNIIDFFKDIPGEIMDILKAFGSDVANVAENIWTSVVNFFEKIPGDVVGALKKVPGLVLKLIELWAFTLGYEFRIIKDIFVHWVPTAIKEIIDELKKLPGQVSSVLVSTWNTIWFWFFKIKGMMHDVIWDAIHDVVNFFIALPGEIANTAISLWNAVTGLSSKIWHGMVDTVSNMITAIINFFTNLPGQIANFASGLWGAANRTASQVWHGFMDTVNQLPGLMEQVLQNVWNKITGWAGKMYDGTKKVADSIWNAFKNGLGIKSPSYLEKAMTAIADNSHATVATMTDNVDKLADLGRKAVQVTKNPSTTINSGGSTMAFANLAINGDINFANQADIGFFFQKLGRNVELTQQGLTPVR